MMTWINVAHRFLGKIERQVIHEVDFDFISSLNVKNDVKCSKDFLL